MHESQERGFMKRSRDRVSTWSRMTKLQGNQALSWQKPVLTQKKFSRRWTSFIKARPWKHLKRCFLILKSLNSDNLQRRLKESIEALVSFCSSEHMPLKEAFEEEQSRWSSSEHMLVKENSQDEWLLWPIYRLAKWPLINGIKIKAILKGKN